ncbi:MAG: hypothetical protein NTY07_19560 [Bacteroidia bacterium]|nr:hypothetical protein [Bacteroidia bacterium]
MEVNWLVLGIIAFCAVILVVYLIRRNLKDKNEVAESFNEEVKTERDFELDNDDEL